MKVSMGDRSRIEMTELGHYEAKKPSNMMIGDMHKPKTRTPQGHMRPFSTRSTQAFRLGDLQTRAVDAKATDTRTLEI